MYRCRLKVLCVTLFAWMSWTTSASAVHPIAAEAVLTVRGPLPPPPRGVSDLKFRDMFTLPVGPLGLVATPRLRMLDGKRVRLIGYMVQQETVTAGMFLLAPLPVILGDEDESLADDLPASVVLVRINGAAARPIPHRAGLIQLTGVLSTAQPNAASIDGRAFGVSLAPDVTTKRALLQKAPVDASPMHSSVAHAHHD